MAAEATYLGISMARPVVLQNGAAGLFIGRAAVEGSIMDILTTPIGSRFFLPEYGSRVEELLYEPNDAVMENTLRLFIFEALVKWEKRAKFTEVEIEVSGAVANCTIFYTILQSNEIESFVFPFYRKLDT